MKKKPLWKYGGQSFVLIPILVSKNMSFMDK